MSNSRSYLLATVAVLVFLTETCNGFSLRIYPAFAPTRAYQIRQSPIVQEAAQPAVMDTIRGTNSEFAAPMEPAVFKSMGYRRGGPLNDCTTYADCKQRLMTYLDVMMKMSNKG